MVEPIGGCWVEGGETGFMMLIIGGVFFVDDQHLCSCS